MKNRILLGVTCFLIVVYMLLDGSSDTTIFLNDLYINVKDTNTNEITRMPLEDYVVGVVSAEMPASFDEEALKAQAIASRSYALYKMQHSKENYDVVTDVTNQAYITVDKMKNKWGSDFDKYYNKIIKCVDETKGKVMTYNDEVIKAFFFAMSNGYTESAKSVFNEDLNYLKSVEVKYDNNDLKNYEYTKEYSKNDFIKLLNIQDNEIIISNIKKNATGRVESLEINNKKYLGTKLRSILGLRSCDFNIKISNDKVYITTKGYGHGVGMSQYGANGMAKDGYSYEDILNYYYQDIKIMSI